MPLETFIADTRKAVDADAAKAHVVFAAEGTLVGVTEVDIRTGRHTFKVDEPRSLGGGNVAANPMQYALAALGSCQAITYRVWAAQLGMELDSVTVRVEGDLDIRGLVGMDQVRPGFSAVRVEVSVTGPETPGALHRACRRGGRALPRPRPVLQSGAGYPCPGHLAVASAGPAEAPGARTGRWSVTTARSAKKD